jgi:hypothetical protein
MVGLNRLQTNSINYSQWNLKIAQYFFNTEKAGCTVSLYVTEELINSLGISEKVDYQDFIKAIRNSVGMTKNGICQKAVQTMENWKSRYGRQGYPPYIAYLAVFVLASGTEDDFSHNAYYPRLRKLLRENPNSKPYPDFEHMQKLWRDLEKWANVDKSGELGFFNINNTGRLVHVGIPISQTLLTERELKVLPSIFAKAGLEAIYFPSEKYIALLLVKHGRSYLRKRTLDMLETTSENKELHCALIEKIVDELRAWDGTVGILSEQRIDLERSTQVYVVLKLCCKLDLIAKYATFTLRCTTKHEFPEDGLKLCLNNNNYSCYEHGNTWSSLIRLVASGRNIDASQLDWCQDVQMKSPDKKWNFRLSASPIRIFIEGKNIGLPGLVEVGQMPKGSSFYLLVHRECHTLIELWGVSSCEGFENLSYIEGLPKGWKLFKVAVAINDEIVRDKYSILSFSNIIRLDLQGGIRIDKGNYFFKFAPPKLILQGADESIKLYCNGKFLENQLGVGGIYELPLDIQVNTKIEIEARNGKDIIKHLSLFLVEDFSFQTSAKIPKLNKFGLIHINQDENYSGVIGAFVDGINCDAFDFNTLLPVQGKQHIIFMGKEPGQVVSYPQESIPLDWYPVWAIAKGKLFDKAMFCGTSLKESEPSLLICKNKEKLILWKKILLDKRTLPPIEDIRMQKLWEKFKKGAKRA